MAKIKYTEHKFKPASLQKIAKATAIIAEYKAANVQITLRQLYYQFVARNFIKNNQQEYDNLQRTITHARRAGLIDWDAIIDRTRNLVGIQTWSSPAEIVRSCAWSYYEDLWADQKYFPIVMVEKDAAIGTIESVCAETRVPYMSNRGYVSDAELHTQAMRIARLKAKGKTPVILYAGDFDPSGWDMTRDIDERFTMFIDGCDVQRLVLNPEQIEVYNPPPNFVKQTDSRASKFMQEHNTDECYELDAVPPLEIVRLVREAVDRLRNKKKWKVALSKETDNRATLETLTKRWADVKEFLHHQNGSTAARFVMTFEQLATWFVEYFECDGSCDGAGLRRDCTHVFTYRCESCDVRHDITGATISEVTRLSSLTSYHQQPACDACGYAREEITDETADEGSQDDGDE